MKLSRFFAISVIAFAIHFSLLACEQRVTSKMEDVAQTASVLAEKVGAENVLIAFDIDNTLLAMDGDLGSDQWFSWQEENLFSGNGNKSVLVANNFAGLLKVQGLLYSLKPMSPPEDKTPFLVRSLQAKGHKVISLTSRGYDFQYSTLRELLRNGINFSRAALAPIEKFSKPAKPYDPKTVRAVYGFSSEDMKQLKLNREPREVLYADGLFFMAGQNKGVMLQILLHESGFMPKAVIFVDDNASHTAAVYETCHHLGVHVVTFQYIHEDKRVVAFNKSDKSAVIREWNELKHKLDNEGLVERGVVAKVINFFKEAI